METVKWWELRWPEIDALDRDRTVILIPTGAIEQHGPHLPVDTDIHDSYELSLRAATAAPGPVVVAPPVWWGTSPHHMAYPGTISLRLETFAALLSDICASIAHHGFRRLILVNGHGGNSAPLGAIALDISAEHHLFVQVVTYWHLIVPELRSIGTSELGGMGHACEMETSLQLHLRGERVDMANARKDMPHPLTRWNGIDFREPGPALFPWDFARDSREGVMGDPTVATEEKGARIAQAAVARLVALIEDYRAADLESRPAMRGAGG